MDDHEAGRLLGRHAQAPPPSPESLRAVLDRHRRWRVRNLVVVVAAALVAGALGGRLAVRPAEPASEPSAVLADLDGEQLASLYGVDPEPDPTETGPAGGAETAPAGGGEGRPAGEARRLVPFERVFVRTADGIAIRAYRADPPRRPPCPEGRNCPSLPSECVPAMVVVPELSNEGAVSPRRPVPVFEEPDGAEAVVLHYGIFGAQERASAQWVAVATGPDVATVSVTFADGSTDQMQPVDGLAVLAHGITLPDPPTPGDEDQRPRPELGGRIEGTTRSGGEISPVDISRDALQAQRPEGCFRAGPGRPGGPGRGPLGGGSPRRGPRAGENGPRPGGPFGPGTEGERAPQGGQPS